MVTGTSKGEIGVWSLENSQLQAYLLGHSDSITEAIFLSPRPLLLTTSHDSLICLWTLDHTPQPFICIFSCINKSMKNFDELYVNTPVAGAMIGCFKDVEISRCRRKKSNEMVIADSYRNFE